MARPRWTFTRICGSVRRSDRTEARGSGAASALRAVAGIAGRRTAQNRSRVARHHGAEPSGAVHEPAHRPAESVRSEAARSADREPGFGRTMLAGDSDAFVFATSTATRRVGSGLGVTLLHGRLHPADRHTDRIEDG